MTTAERTAFSPDEIAERTGTSRAEVMRAIHAGDLRAKKRPGGRKYLVTAEAEAEWLESLPDA